MRLSLYSEKVNVSVMFRFPKWSQGLWSNIQVYRNVAYYTNVFHERDDVDDTQKNSSAESSTMDSHYQNGQANKSFDYGTTQENIQCMTHSSTHQNQQSHETTTFKWRCIMSVDNDKKQLLLHETGAMFLIYGGRIMEKKLLNINDKK